LCLFCIAIHLPMPHVGWRLLPDKALHVLRRVAQKQADLVREALPLLKPIPRAEEAPGRLLGQIALPCQNGTCLFAAKIGLQAVRAVQIDQRRFVLNGQGKEAKTLGGQLAVE